MILELLHSMRIFQWTKNLILFAGAVFTLKILDPVNAVASLLGFLLFSLAASGVYVLNDVFDMERDRLHPEKRTRPVASGRLPIPVAVIGSSALLATGLAGSFFLGPRFASSTLAYVVLTIGYSIFLKRIVLLDVMTIALGFVIRAIAGVELMRDLAPAGEPPLELSPWLLVCAFFLALFLAIGKRRHELATLEGNAARHRAALGFYNAKLLDQLVAVVTGATVLAYSIYTIAPETLEKYGGRPLYLSIPFVLYGVFRYLYLMYAEEKGGNPSELFVSDRATLLNVLLWVLVVVAILLWPEA